MFVEEIFKEEVLRINSNLLNPDVRILDFSFLTLTEGTSIENPSDTRGTEGTVRIGDIQVDPLVTGTGNGGTVSEEGDVVVVRKVLHISVASETGANLFTLVVFNNLVIYHQG